MNHGQPTVYRFYGAAGDLLYVGKTLGYEARLSTHKSASPWWPLVKRIDLERFDDEGVMRDAERLAILAERPRFNRQGLPVTFGHPFRMLRQSKLLTREQLADAAGCSAAAVIQYESGRNMPRVSTACRLADALGVTFEDVARCFVPAREPART